MQASNSLKSVLLSLLFVFCFTLGFQSELNAAKKTELRVHFKAIGRHTRDLSGKVILPNKKSFSKHFSTSEHGIEEVGESKIKILSPAPSGLYTLRINRKDHERIKHIESCFITVTFPNGEERTFGGKYLSENTRYVEFCFYYKK